MNDTSSTSNASRSNRVAVVTGATKGIGHAIAHALAADGFKVAVSSRTETDARDFAAALADAHGGETLGMACDVRDPEACAALMAATADRWRALDVLINNAGVGSFANTRDLEIDDWSLQIDTNLSGVFYCTKAALPHLLESDDAWIINIASLASRNAFSGGAAYNASKFGLLGLTEAMMLDLRHDGIRVSAIMPGSVNTYFHDRTPTEPGWKLESEDVARAVMDLLAYPGRAHPSRVELRPSQPPQK